MECKSKEEYLITFAYPVCRDGYMHCEDEYAEGDYTGGEIPCPSCRPIEWMTYYRKKIIEKGRWAALSNHNLPLMIDCGVRGGFPRSILYDKKAMRTVRRWIRRGWNIGKKQIAQQRKAEARNVPGSHT